MPYDFIPLPRHIEYTNNEYTPSAQKLYVAAPQAVTKRLRVGLDDFCLDINELTGMDVTTRIAAEPMPGHVSLILDDTPGPNPEAYRVLITPEGIRVSADDCRGLYYGLQTLTQLWKQAGRAPLECLTITDEPDLPFRGMIFDLRLQTYTLDYIRRFIRTLANYKINVLVIEYSDKFPYSGDYHVIRNQNGFSEEEVRAIVDCCHEHFVEIIPFVQSFAHMEYLLRTDRFRYLRENDQYDSQICPLHPDSLRVSRDLLQQVMRLHRYSTHVSIGGDEPYHLGECPRCAEYASEYGKGGLYILYVNKLCRVVRDMGLKTSTCSDKLMAYPHVLPLLDRDCTVMDWDYWTYDDHPAKVMNWNTLQAVDREGIGQASSEMRRFLEEVALDGAGDMIPFPYTRRLIEAGLTVIGVCSTASVGPDCHWVPRYDVHIPNIHAYCRKIKEYGGLGILNSAWERFLFELTYYGIIFCGEQCWSTTGADMDEFNGRFVRLFYGIDDPELVEWQYRITRPFAIVEKRFPMTYQRENYGRIATTVFDIADNEEMRQNIQGAAAAYAHAAERVRWNRHNLEEWQLGAAVKWFWYEVTRCYAEAAKDPSRGNDESVTYLDSLLTELKETARDHLNRTMPREAVELKLSVYFVVYEELRDEMLRRVFRHTGIDLPSGEQHPNAEEPEHAL